VCLLLVWRVCDHAFGRYMPLKGAESGHVIVTKTENLHIEIRTKIHWFEKCYSFRSTTKNYEVNADKPFQNSGVTSACGAKMPPITLLNTNLGRLELTLVVNTSF